MTFLIGVLVGAGAVFALTVVAAWRVLPKIVAVIKAVHEASSPASTPEAKRASGVRLLQATEELARMMVKPTWTEFKAEVSARAKPRARP